MTGKVCKAVNYQHFFKTAFGAQALEPNNRYYFEIRCVKGSNFKIGIAEGAAREQTNQAFSDTAYGYAYFSNGQLRHNSKGQGPIYGEPYKEEDVIGCYVDLIDVSTFFLLTLYVYRGFFSTLKTDKFSRMLTMDPSCLVRHSTLPLVV